MKKNNCKFKNTFFYSLISILSIIILIISILVGNGKLDQIDTKILTSISSIRNPFLTRLMIFISEFVNPLFLIVMVIFLLFLINNKRTKILVIVNSLGAYVLTNFLKIIFARERPIIFMIITEKFYSFPSGHALIGTSFYGILAYLCFKEIKQKHWKYISCCSLILLSLLISFSRLYLGVHYLSDVMTGILIGVIILIVEINILNKGKCNYGKSIRSKKK